MPTYAAGSAHPLPQGDEALVTRLMQGDHSAFEVVMRQHNPHLFRLARSIVRNDTEAEDVLQEAYLDAYRRIETFRGNASLST